MKKLLSKNVFKFALICGVLFFTSCASTKFQNGEESVEYKKLDYKYQNKKQLTEKELREDCDMLKYLIYNSYAGIDEAIQNGFDLDATIEEIYTKSLEKKTLDRIPTSDFSSITKITFAQKLNNTDQHINIGGSLKDSKLLYYTKVFFEKKDNKYFVKKSEEKDIQIGMEYTGPEQNLFEILTEEGILYRYGVMTNLKIKTAQLSVNNQKFSVEAKTDKPIPTKQSWSGIKSTQNTIYVSLGDCQQATGISDRIQTSDAFWNDYLSQVSEQAAGKTNAIFDLRSNQGGYREFPAKILRALYYNQNSDDQLSKDIEALFINTTGINCVNLVSPVTEYNSKEYFENNKNFFERYKPEVKEFYKDYWKHMKTRPIRKFISMEQFQTNLSELPQPDFQGDIYILLNQNSASAAEFGTLMAYELKNKGITVHIIGENSCGAFKYGGMMDHFLPNSGLWLSTGIFFGEPPLMLETPNWHGEGNGFYPDYWATNDTILNTLIELTNDQELKEVLAGIEKSLL